MAASSTKLTQDVMLSSASRIDAGAQDALGAFRNISAVVDGLVGGGLVGDAAVALQAKVADTQVHVNKLVELTSAKSEGIRKTAAANANQESDFSARFSNASI